MENKLENVDWELIEKVASMGTNAQYSMLFEALKVLVDEEDSTEMLAMIAASLYELSETALKRSGYPVIADGSEAIN